MTVYTAEDLALAARRIEVAIERREPDMIGLKHLRLAVVALRLVDAEADMHRRFVEWHRREHEPGKRQTRASDASSGDGR